MFYTLAHGYFDGFLLKSRLEPILNKKNSGGGSNELFYPHIHFVWQDMKERQAKAKVRCNTLRYIIHDKRYHFKSAFDTETGAYVRTGVLDVNGKDTGVDPFMASYPHLIDVGIMGHCMHG